MTSCVALFRAVNVAGHQKVAMDDLRTMLSGLGYAGVASLLQSGNVVFRGGARPPRELEREIERAAAAQLGLEADVFVRTAAEWSAIVDANAFPEEAENDPGRLIVAALKDEPRATAVAALQGAITGRERVRCAGRHAYIVYPDGMGRSRLTTAVIERKLGTRCTCRNWNTVLRLRAALADPGR